MKTLTEKENETQRNVTYTKAKNRMMRLYQSIVRQPRLQSIWQDFDEPFYICQTSDKLHDYVSCDTERLVSWAKRDAPYKPLTFYEDNFIGEEKTERLNNLRWKLHHSSQNFATLMARTDNKNRLLSQDHPNYAVKLFDKNPAGQKLSEIAIYCSRNRELKGIDNIISTIREHKQKVINRIMTEPEYDYLVNTDIKKIVKEWGKKR